MAKIYLSAIIPAPVADVWSLAGDYGGIAGWHPVVNTTQVKDGPAQDQVGAIRECELDGGAKLLERQTARSEDEHFYSYVITESPMPMKNYEGTIRLRPVTESGATFIEWTADFDPDPGSEEELTGMISSVYKAGFASLKARFAGG